VTRSFHRTERADYYDGGVYFRGTIDLGPSSAVAEGIQRYQAAGVSDLRIRLMGENQVAQREKFIAEVLSKFK
jgi:hypothetical protein